MASVTKGDNKTCLILEGSFVKKDRLRRKFCCPCKLCVLVDHQVAFEAAQ